MPNDNCIIIISHSNYRIKSAGVEKYITEVTELLDKNGVQHIHVFPIIELNRRLNFSGHVCVGVNFNGKFVGVFNELHLTELLLQMAKDNELHYLGVHLNHLHGWNLDILKKTLLELDLPVKVIIHDYEMICSGMLKTDGRGPECRKNISVPEAHKCEGCRYLNSNLDRYRNIRSFIKAIDILIDSVIAPSEIAGENWLKGFEFCRDKLIIREHLEFEGEYVRDKHSGKLRIAYVGSTAPHKGFEEWKSLIRQLKTEQYEFYYFGKEHPDLSNVEEICVDFQKKNSKGMTEQLRDHQIDLVFLWSTWHETYCYTAYEAYLAGCMLLTVEYSGNIAAMVQKYGCGRIFQSLNECISFLNDEPQVRSFMDGNDHSRPKLSRANSSLKELMFDETESERCLDPYQKKTEKQAKKIQKKIHKNKLLTEVYKRGRVDY